METYLFKFSACLVVFWLVYILFLERQTMHRFKRFYLLIAIGSALLIPTLTLTEYVEPTPSDFEVSTVYVPFQPSLIEQPQVQAPFFDLETVLWMLYGLGVFVFAIRFIVNLYKMYKRISAHQQIKKRPFIYVLLEECRIPHSFFKYLFFERSKYETDAIPDEVKLHEETHARQLHSLDIIGIELLQIVFWFHPLIYILKHHIKLNHEFLADQAVLDEGVDTKAYQKTLLQFSSNAHEYQLSSTINYSSIKKRFTVMKTQTSKTRMWWSSLLLLPIIAILFYSFAEREYVEKEPSKTPEVVKSENTSNSEKLTQQKLPTEKEIEAYNVWAKKIHTESKVLSKNARWFPPINEEDFINFTEIYKRMSPSQKKQSIEYPFPGRLDVNGSEQSFPSATPTQQEKATAKQVAAYNTWAETINKQMAKAKANNDVNAYPIVKVKDIKKYKAIYNIMTDAQRKNSEAWPSFPPPPPPPTPATRLIKINGETLLCVYFVPKRYYNKSGYLVDRYGKTINGNKQVNASDVFPGQYITKVYSDGNVVVTFKDNQPERTKGSINIPPPNPKSKVYEPKEKGDPIEINGTTYYFTEQNGKTTYYDSYGNVVDINKIPPPPPIPNNATPEQKSKMKKATEAYMKANPDKVGKVKLENGEEVDVVEVPSNLEGSIDINGETFYYTTSNGKTTYYNGSGKEVKMDNLPPPPPTPPAPKAKTEDDQNKTTFDPKTTDITALKVTENRTEYNGIYYHYEIKNTGNTIIPANSYSVFLKVNGKTISFDKATSELKPGQTLKYKSEKTFYKKDHDVINYVLEIKMDDSNSENNILKGQSKF